MEYTTSQTPATENNGTISQRPEDVKPIIQTKGDHEAAPLVKHDERMISYPGVKSKPVSLTFKDLSYSVQIMNPNKKSIQDSKCSFGLKSIVYHHSCKTRYFERNDWNL